MICLLYPQYFSARQPLFIPAFERQYSSKPPLFLSLHIFLSTFYVLGISAVFRWPWQQCDRALAWLEKGRVQVTDTCSAVLERSKQMMKVGTPRGKPQLCNFGPPAPWLPIQSSRVKMCVQTGMYQNCFCQGTNTEIHLSWPPRKHCNVKCLNVQEKGACPSYHKLKNIVWQMSIELSACY